MKKRFSALLLACTVLSALAIPASAYGYSDLDSSHWSYPYVSYLVSNGIMETDFYDCFYPDVETSRGEFVMYLWRAAGYPDADFYGRSFDDVYEDDPWFCAVEWAVQNGVTTGTSYYSFSPYDALTREQAFTFLCRALPLFGVYTDGYRDMFLYGFYDFDDVSYWAVDSMNTLYDFGIVTGTDAGYLMPKRDVTNAATATIIYKTLYIADML